MGSVNYGSEAYQVAVRMTWTASEMTWPGRLWPVSPMRLPHIAGWSWPFRFLLAGVGLIATAVALVGVFIGMASYEQALAPGEKSFGVAVLAMLFALPTLCAAGGGLALLVLSATTWLFLRIQNRN